MVEENNNIMVSVICLTYNHEKYIEQALQGILKQKTKFKYEVIVCNDASTDNTSVIVEKYRKEHPKLIKLINKSQNEGGSKCLYDALSISRGKYLAGCEGDDFWIDELKLQTQVDFLESHPEYVGCTHDVLLVDEGGTKRRGQYVSWLSNKRVYKPKDFKGIYLPGHASTAVRRNLFLLEGFDGSFIYKADKNIGDRTLTLLWLNYGMFYKIKGKKSAYRVVRKKDAVNTTSKIYTLDKNGVLYDYNYILKLESYAKENMSLNVSFEYQKKNLFAKAVIKWLLGYGIENREVAKRIMNESGQKFNYVLSLPYFVGKKIIHKIRNAV